MNQISSPPTPIPTGLGGWAWPRLLRQLGIGPSAAGMLALPYLHRIPGPAPTLPDLRSGRRS
jgi:hypothetical protein